MFEIPNSISKTKPKNKQKNKKKTRKQSQKSVESFDTDDTSNACTQL